LSVKFANNSAKKVSFIFTGTLFSLNVKKVIFICFGKFVNWVDLKRGKYSFENYILRGDVSNPEYEYEKKSESEVDVMFDKDANQNLLKLNF
jgi:hypothetical protein